MIHGEFFFNRFWTQSIHLDSEFGFFWFQLLHQNFLTYSSSVKGYCSWSFFKALENWICDPWFGIKHWIQFSSMTRPDKRSPPFIFAMANPISISDWESGERSGMDRIHWMHWFKDHNVTSSTFSFFWLSDFSSVEQHAPMLVVSKDSVCFTQANDTQNFRRLKDSRMKTQFQKPKVWKNRGLKIWMLVLFWKENQVQRKLVSFPKTIFVRGPIQRN